MSRAKEIEAQIDRLKAELAGISPLHSMGVRELARAAGVAPTTVTRARRGAILNRATMKKLMPFMDECPCCGQKIEKQS